MDKEQAFALLNLELDVFKTAPDKWRSGYINGLLTAFSHCSLLSDDDYEHFFDQLTSVVFD